MKATRDIFVTNEIKFSRLSIDIDRLAEESTIQSNLLSPREVIRISDKYSEFGIHQKVLDLLVSNAAKLKNVETGKSCFAADITVACKVDGDGEYVYQCTKDSTSEALIALLGQGWSLYRSEGKDCILVFESTESSVIRQENCKRASWGAMFASLIESLISESVHWDVPRALCNHDDFVTPGTIFLKDHKGDSIFESVFGDETEMSNANFVVEYMERFLQEDIAILHKCIFAHRWDMFSTRFWNSHIELHRLGDARAYIWSREQLHKKAMQELEE